MNQDIRQQISQWIGRDYIDGTSRRLLQAAMDEIERYRALCAAAYQLAGTMNAPIRFLDALSDASNGEIEERAKTDDLLPVNSSEVGCFPEWTSAEHDALLQLEKAIRHDREMFDGTSDEDNPMGVLVKQALVAIDAARKVTT